jgi:hypothetical protein
MTTFTIQDLTINNLPTTPEEDEAMETLSEKQFVEYGMNNPLSTSAVEYATQHAPVPQPTCGQPVHTPDLSTIVNNICTQLQLLTTIISQPKAQPEGGENSLQECVETTLQQAKWFKEMVGACIDEDMVRDAVKDAVESEVDSYFRNEFDPTYHFDFGDAVCSEVSDQLDDVVRDRLDEVVQEQLEEVVAEKLKSIRVVFD